MIRYKVDVLEELKKAGYSTYRIRKEKLFGERTLQTFRTGAFIASGNNLETLCRLLSKQPGDLIEYVDEKAEA